jgi:DNA-binding transcriptional regulator/RsmH inhibitor MraZ
LTLRDGTLGQNLTETAAESPPALDAEGRIRLPAAVRSHLDEAARIAVEIRPEGILLRPEHALEDDTDALLQDMLPGQRNGSRKRKLRFWRNGDKEEAQS